MSFRNALCALLLLAAPRAQCEQTFPSPEWREEPNPQASPLAEPGGALSIAAHQYPKSFNFYLETTASARGVFVYLFETLLDLDGTTLEPIPSLAERWTVSDDKMTFTFFIDPEAKWSDGSPVTAHDVLYTYDAVLKPEHLTGPHKVGLERLERPEVLDERTIRFRAKNVHWANLENAGTFDILPKHVFENLDFNKVNFEFPVVSGPYRLGRVREGVSARLERRDDYWANEKPRMKNLINFQTLELRFYSDEDNSFDAFKNGELDLYPVYTAHRWINQTSGEPFDKNWIVKQEVYNHSPQGFQGWAMNLRKAPYDDLRVRRALAHLVNREEMNRTHMYNQYRLERSYFSDLYDQDRPCENTLIPFDKDAARALLHEAGWAANPKTGILEKDGKPFVVTFLTRDASTDKFLNIYREDLKDVGIELEIDRKDWAAWVRDMEEYNFDMTWASWSAGVRKDPEGMWHSKEADRPGGNNVTGFKHPRVDELIEEQREIFDVKRRTEMIRQIDGILTEQIPYILLWSLDYTRLLYWNKFGMPDQVLSKYGEESSAYNLWWNDPDSAADLEAAMESDDALPPRLFRVVFDDEFDPR